MNIPAELRYSSDHEWVRVDGATATIGITEYAQDALGDVVFVEMPDAGLAVAAGESFSEVESTKSVSDIYAPLTGSISEVNAELEFTILLKKLSYNKPDILTCPAVRHQYYRK